MSLFIIFVPISYMLFALDKINDYLYIKMISYDEKIINEIKNKINNDSIYSTIIYNTLTLTENNDLNVNDDML